MLADEEMLMKSENQGNMPVLQTATAVATSFLIYRAATYLTKLYGIQGGTLPGVTSNIRVIPAYELTLDECSMEALQQLVEWLRLKAGNL